MKVVVLGAGYAGVTVARRLERSLPAAVELLVISDSSTHLIQHELHRVIRRPDFASQLTIPLETLVDRAEVREARVMSVDADSRAVVLDSGRESYDFVAVCIGADVDFHELSGVREHAVPLKRVSDALAIREGFMSVLEAGGRVVVGGAGLSGVQVAGELAAFAREESARDAVEIVLVEQYGSVAPGFPGPFQSAIHEELTDRGVVVRTGETVRGVTDGGVELDSERVSFEQFVWTGGIQGTNALEGDRPVVRGTLRASDRVFVVGDAARVVDRNGSVIPASAQAAIAEGRTAATNIQRLVDHALDGGVIEPRLAVCEFDPPGWIVSVGDGAVALVGPTVVRGAPAVALKSTVGVGYLSSVGEVRRALSFARREFSPARA